MPVVAEWAIMGLSVAVFLFVFKTAVLTTPLNRVPGLAHFAGTV